MNEEERKDNLNEIEDLNINTIEFKCRQLKDDGILKNSQFNDQTGVNQTNANSTMLNKTCLTSANNTFYERSYHPER